jgi:hypothetical protein
MGYVSRKKPFSLGDRTDAERDADRFVEHLDEAFIKRLVEAGAFTYEAEPGLPEATVELYEELSWVLRKIGFIEPASEPRRARRPRGR